MFRPHFQRTTVEELASGKKHPWLSGRPPTRTEVVRARNLVRRRAQAKKLIAAKVEASASPPKDKKDEPCKTTTGTAQTDVRFCYHVCACHKVDEGPWNTANTKPAQPDKKNAKDNQGTKQDSSNKDTPLPPLVLPPSLPPEKAPKQKHVRFDIDTKNDSGKADTKNKAPSNKTDKKAPDEDKEVTGLLHEISESKGSGSSREAIIRQHEMQSSRQALEMELLEQDLRLLEARKEDTRIALDFLAEERKKLLEKVKSWQKEHSGDNTLPISEINKRIREFQNDSVREAAEWMAERDEHRRREFGWFEFEDRDKSTGSTEFSDLYERIKSLSAPPMSKVLRKLEAWELIDENITLPGMKYSHQPNTPITITLPAKGSRTIHAFKRDNKLVDAEGREIVIVEIPSSPEDPPRRVLRRKPGGILKKKESEKKDKPSSDNNNDSPWNATPDNNDSSWNENNNSDSSWGDNNNDNNDASWGDNNNNNNNNDASWGEENKDNSDRRSSFSKSRDGSRSPTRDNDNSSWTNNDSSSDESNASFHLKEIREKENVPGSQPITW